MSHRITGLGARANRAAGAGSGRCLKAWLVPGPCERGDWHPRFGSEQFFTFYAVAEGTETRSE